MAALTQGRPNIVFVFADQWRAQAAGYVGNDQVETPNLDALATESLVFSNAVAGIPVCCPARATLLTGQRPLTHGVFLNDVHLSDDAVTMGEIFTRAGYDTAYIGKWHVDGRGRSDYIPPQSRHAFAYWKVLECTHDYNHSLYYAQNEQTPSVWDGYDAIAQTEDAVAYLRQRVADGEENPFLLVLSWGPPHDPYQTAPEEYRQRYSAPSIRLRPNVPEALAGEARTMLAGYYAHCTALDECVGTLLQTLNETGLAENTIFVFTSDHGDMLGSQGQTHKQRPWDESIRVPLLLRFPAEFGRQAREISFLIDTPDLLPTLMGLCDLPPAPTVEGTNFAGHLRTETMPAEDAVLITCVHPFGQYAVAQGGREYRGLRTQRYTYVRDLNGPWLLYDNQEDPYQLDNLVNRSEALELQETLDDQLQSRLSETDDQFLPGMEYVRRWGYPLDETGTVPYRW